MQNAGRFGSISPNTERSTGGVDSIAKVDIHGQRSDIRNNIMKSKSSSRMQVGTTLTIGKNMLISSDGKAGLSRKSRRTNLHMDGGLEGPAGSKSGRNDEEIQKDRIIDVMQLNVWFHERRVSEEDVLVSSASFPGLKAGDVCKLIPIDSNTNGIEKELVFVVQPETLIDNDFRQGNINANSAAQLASTASNAAISKSKFQISLLSTPLQGLLDIAARSTVQVNIVEDIKEVEVDMVEITIRDINMSRDSMWNFSSTLVGSAVYTDKRLHFADSRIGFVNRIYRNAKKVLSGYISENTKVIFRSRSAKIVFLIQLSLEMWHFEETGEIMFHKLVNTLFPKIFKKWRDNEAHHSISIVLFTSVDVTNVPWSSFGPGERPAKRRDYFRVVVDQISTYFWDRIMEILRLEFANFKRDILLNREPTTNEFFVRGKTLVSSKGNVLEAINISLRSLSDKFKSADLKHTVNHFILITPGTGLFDVEYDLMEKTSQKMLECDVDLDIISLSQPPLHVSPLFRFKDPHSGELIQSIPHWCDISFYIERPANSFQWVPRCKMYELQMMGVMEREANNIAIRRIRSVLKSSNVIEAMDIYDDGVFDSPRNKLEDEINDEENLNAKPKDVINSLMLVWTSKNLNSRPSSSSSAKTDVSTTNLSAVGTVTNASYHTSALSSLYALNKFSDPPVHDIIKSKMNSTIKQLNNLKSEIEPINVDMNIPLKKHSTENILMPEKQEVESRPTLARSAEKSRTFNGKGKPKNLITVEDQEQTEFNQLWTRIFNPSQDPYRDFFNSIKSSRWSDIFPSKVRKSLFKWTSLRAPASLPITTSKFPTTEQLLMGYNLQVYSVLLNSVNELEISTTRHLMREMIQLRLLLGFQVCFGDAVENFEQGRSQESSSDILLKYFPAKSCFGTKIYLSSINEIHRIHCDYNGSLSVQLYIKRPPEQKKAYFGSSIDTNYCPLIRTRYSEEFSPLKIENVLDSFTKYNWNQLDQHLAGYEDVLPKERNSFYRMKFVVLPSDIPSNAFFISNENLTDEEIRVEGLRKLIGLIERGKYMKGGDRAQTKRNEEILPDISFYTGNLYQFLSDEVINQQNGNQVSSLVSCENVKLSQNIKLTQLGQILQGNNGLKLVDRIWHFKKHPRCFLGSELVSFLIENFEDLENRDEATKFGQDLMDKGLFRHVEMRHGFLDGYYFYEFEPEYVFKFDKNDKNSNNWFKMKKTSEKTSTPGDSSPFIKHHSDVESTISPTISAHEGINSKISASIISHADSELSQVSGSLLQHEQSRRKFILSRSIKFDADPLKTSYRPEIIKVHYDVVHNPDHCFHIRLEWLNTTNKFIDEVITNWSRLCDRHGLKLVETPWVELCRIPVLNPFHSFVDIELAVDPWTDEEFKDCEALVENKFYFHLFLLEMSDFYLDNRSSIFFSKENIQISYSWGDPMFKYAQYIHKTGLYIVELRDNGGFFLAPNNVHIKRVNSTINYMNDTDGVKENASKFASEKVMLSFRASCTNKSHLRQVFTDAKQRWHDMESMNIL